MTRFVRNTCEYIEEIWAYIEIFYYSKLAQTCLATFSIKKVLWPNHLSQSFKILHKKTVDHVLLDNTKQNSSI